MLLRHTNARKFGLVFAIVFLAGITCGCDVTVDEAGNGFSFFFNGTPFPLSSGVAADPGPGGGSNVLFYVLPQTVVSGDIVVHDPDGSISDLFRIESDPALVSGTSVLFVYSVDHGLPGDQPIPTARQTNVIDVTEDPTGNVVYIPTPGQPAFNSDETATYRFQSPEGPPDSLQFRYVSNLNVGDGVINITNTGSSGGNLCVNVYAFDPSEEMVSCCSCVVTPNALVSLSAQGDLIANTLSPSTPTSLVIALLATPANGTTCGSEPAPGMRAWGTTLHALPGTPVKYGVTEGPFLNSVVNFFEVAHLTTFCGFIQNNGSGFGVCKSCRSGGLGGSKK